MKTNRTISFNALNTAFYCINDKEHLTNEIVLTVKHTRYLWEKLTDNRRSKIHSIAFQALFEIVRISNSLPKGYYISNPQMKAFLMDHYDEDFKELLSNACKELEQIRNEHLEG